MDMDTNEYEGPAGSAVRTAPAGTAMSDGPYADYANPGGAAMQPKEQEEQETRGIVASARAEKVQVRGIVGIVSATKAKLTGISPFVIASDEVEIEKGGSFLAAAGHEVELKNHGYAAIALAPKIEVKDGGRVLITPLIAILFGLAVGGGFGLVAVLGYYAITRMGPIGRLRARRAMKNSAVGQVGSRAEIVRAAVKKALAEAKG